MLDVYSQNRAMIQLRGEEVFYISNPGLGLWAHRGKLNEERQSPKAEVR